MKLHSAIFYTHNIDAVEEFYTHMLGLELDYRSGDMFISFLFPNGIKLGIKKAVEEREIPGSQTIFIEVENIKEWYRRAQDNGWTILKQLVEENWATNFSILDPDKNKIQIIQTK
jgi:catechol 2,3-dioxygenase-like lactoylglutathione lyase family enzyme